MKTENEYLSLEVNENGGCLKSIYDKKRDKELLYQTIEESWKGQDIFIFPFIARLKDGNYTVDNKEYRMRNHGLIRYMKADMVLEDNNDIKASFTSDENTLLQYPFSFKAYSLYHLSRNRIDISYHILNTDNRDMPFEVGAHPAFMLPGEKKDDEFDISGNTILFTKKMKLERILQEKTASFNIKDIDYEETDHIELSKALFHEIPTLILKAKDIDQVTLKKKDGSRITIHKRKSSFLALWSDQKWGNYVAIEPWDGLPDYVDCPKEMKDKKEIKMLKPNDEYVFSYSIEID